MRSPSERWRVLALAPILVSLACERRAPSVPSSPPPADTKVDIARIDGAAARDGIEVGRVATVELSSNREDITVCALVHPLSSDTWWVQNLPSLPNRNADGAWAWRLVSFFGTETLGRREEYELVAIAERGQNLCVTGRTMKVEQAAKLVRKHPRSRTVTVRRTRD